MTQAVVDPITGASASSRPQMPPNPTHVSAEVIALADYRFPRPARDMDDFRRQFDLFVPDLPDLDGMTELQIAAVGMSHARLALEVVAILVGEQQQ